MNKEKHTKRLQAHVLRILRRRKITQKQLARVSGLNECDISRILQGVDVRYSKGAQLMDMD
jgi:transcriptional regulator with XRE-family HTH domain